MFKSAKNGRLYTPTQVKEAYEAFWAEFSLLGWGKQQNTLTKPVDAWDRFLSALKLEINND